MPTAFTPDQFRGVWSAAPTPFTEDLQIDVPSVKRMVEHHVRLGVKGLFLCGTNGEGPWQTDADKRTLVRTVVKAAAGRLPVAVQVSDNSTARIICNMHAVADAGADIAVIAPPYFLMNATPDNVLKLYLDAIEASPLPIGIYDRGKHSSVMVPESVLKRLYAHPKVALVKDSSQEVGRRKVALAARKQRPELRLLDGDEFNCVEYLLAGYDGLLLGGGVFNGYLAGQIVAAVTAGDIELANRLQERMSQMMFAVYGGPKIACWLSGEKKLLVEMGLFSTWRNVPDYPLTASCIKAIERVLKQDADVLLP